MDNETCERLYNMYYMRVFSYVMTLAGDRHISEEITQEAFFRAFSKSAGFRNESDAVTWLCAIQIRPDSGRAPRLREDR